MEKRVKDIVGKGENACWLPAFSPFPTLFSNPSKKNSIISSTSYSWSAKTFHLNMSKIMTLGKELQENPY